jgi:hypothetical protein
MSLRQQINSLGTAQVPTAGNIRGSVRMLNNMRTIRAYVTIRATVNVTTLATSILNKGSAASLVQLFVNENGRDRVSIDGRVASFLSNAYAAGTPTNIRQTALAVASYNIVERVVLHFSPRNSVVPSETTFAEGTTSAPLFLEALAQPNLFGRLFVGGAGSITALSIEVEQEYVQESAAPLPYFITTFRETIESIPGANSAYQIRIATPHRLRGLVITQDSDGGECSDIINNVLLRGDNGDIIGPTPVTYDDFAQMQENEFPGSMYYPMGAADAQRSRSHVFVNFQQEGRLSRVLYPQRDYTNLRLVFSTAASAQTNPKIKITLIELERPNVSDSGRVMVNPNLPKALL